MTKRVLLERLGAIRKLAGATYVDPAVIEDLERLIDDVQNDLVVVKRVNADGDLAQFTRGSTGHPARPATPEPPKPPVKARIPGTTRRVWTEDCD